MVTKNFYGQDVLNAFEALNNLSVFKSHQPDTIHARITNNYKSRPRTSLEKLNVIGEKKTIRFKKYKIIE